MRADADVKRDVEAELNSDPSVDATDIAVAVTEGVVTVTGFVRSYRKRNAAEAAAKRIAGVVAVVNDIEVRWPLLHQRPDPDIARDAVEAIRRDLPEAADDIKVVVHDGWVTLEGEVDWNYQREEAKWAAYRVRGVLGVSNLIQLKAAVAVADVENAILEIFARNALLDADRITIEVDGGHVRLSGPVESWAEREEAERAVWTVPGVTSVENNLLVGEILS
jgi:osmotically-inducible protein OsmY